MRVGETRVPEENKEQEEETRLTEEGCQVLEIRFPNIATKM
jgi:hypothetical protein